MSEPTEEERAQWEQRRNVRRDWSKRLLDLIDPEFPRTSHSNANQNDWTVIGPAFVLRCARLLRASLFLPDEHDTEAEALVRVLYEHVTTFAWLAIDPASNIRAWVRYEAKQGLKADNDVRQFGIHFLDAKLLADYQALAAETPMMPDLAVRASQADAHWGPIIEAFKDPKYSLRGMYVAIYRQLSVSVHASGDAVRRLVRFGPTPGMRCVGFERPVGPVASFTSAPILFAMCLLVASRTLSFPKEAEVYRTLKDEDGGIVE